MPSIEFITKKHNGALTRIEFENESMILATFKSTKMLPKCDYVLNRLNKIDSHIHRSFCEVYTHCPKSKFAFPNKTA